MNFSTKWKIGSERPYEKAEKYFCQTQSIAVQFINHVELLVVFGKNAYQ